MINLVILVNCHQSATNYHVELFPDLRGGEGRSHKGENHKGSHFVSGGSVNPEM